jgi:hypothetical protein
MLDVSPYPTDTIINTRTVPLPTRGGVHQWCVHLLHIRPLAVRPLAHLERCRSPWGYFFAFVISGSTAP